MKLKRKKSNIEREIEEIIDKYEEPKFTLWDAIKMSICAFLFAFSVIPRYVEACIYERKNKK